jgi:hypothetical protein
MEISFSTDGTYGGWNYHQEFASLSYPIMNQG